MRSVRLVAISLVCALALPLAAPAEGEPDPADFGRHPALAALVKKADRIVLYEGLPHQTWEHDALERELKTKKTVTLHGFPFYEQPITVSEKQAKALTDIYAQPGSLKPYGGPKACGGFHPDWCVEWRIGEQVVRALVCFGCHEVKAFGPDGALICDMSKEAYQRLESLLGPLRKNRPEPERG